MARGTGHITQGYGKTHTAAEGLSRIGKGARPIVQVDPVRLARVVPDSEVEIAVSVLIAQGYGPAVTAADGLPGIGENDSSRRSYYSSSR